MNRKITYNGKTINLDRPIETSINGYPAKFMGTVPKGYDGAIYAVAWEIGGAEGTGEWGMTLFNEGALVGSFRNVRMNPFRETLTEARLAEEYVAWRKREGTNPVVRFGQYIVNNYVKSDVPRPTDTSLTGVPPSINTIFYEQQAGKAFVMIYDLIKGDE